MSRRSDDVTGLVVLVVGVPLVILLGVYVRWFAPCGDLGWLPAAEIPARCLMR